MPAKPLPWELHSASQHHPAVALGLGASVLHLELLCASLSEMCLRSPLLPCLPFQLMKGTGKLYFRIVRGTCTAKVTF